MALITILDAATTGRTARAAARLVFTYLAATQVEAGQREPATAARSVDELPPALRQECRDLARIHRPPGGLWLAYRDGEPVGCVGLVPRALGTAEITHLYVDPAHRGGIGRILVNHAHQHAARNHFMRVVVSVLPSRTGVVEFYRRLGYTDMAPYERYPLSTVNLQCSITPPQQPFNS